jgi:hypothetical protein
LGNCSIEFWLWPNLLSLDAPAIAMLWQTAFARCLRVRVPPTTTIALGMTVWVLYVADRVLDSLTAPAELTATARHRFYRRNRTSASLYAVAMAIATAWLGLTSLPSAVLRDYLALAFGVFLYFVTVHAAPARFRSHWPKELAVAIFFAIGVCLPVWTGSPKPQVEWAVFTAFALLLSMNVLGIELWERDSPTDAKPALLIACAALTLVCAIAALTSAPERELWAAMALSSALLAALGRFRFRLSRNAVRVLADIALLTPLLLLPFAH